VSCDVVFEKFRTLTRGQRRAETEQASKKKEELQNGYFFW
jgi:hypothetical protein